MPFITSKTNIEVTSVQENEIKSSIADFIGTIPGKTENYLFNDFQNNGHLYFRGDSQSPIAFLGVTIFNNESHAGYDEFTKKLTDLYQEVLGIDPHNIIVNYADSTIFGLDGKNFGS